MARFEPGALIGEMGFYQSVSRSATVVAQGRARLVRIEARKLAFRGSLPDSLLGAFRSIAARNLGGLTVGRKMLGVRI